MEKEVGLISLHHELSILTIHSLTTTWLVTEPKKKLSDKFFSWDDCFCCCCCCCCCHGGGGGAC